MKFDFESYLKQKQLSNSVGEQIFRILFVIATALFTILISWQLGLGMLEVLKKVLHK